MPAELVDYLEQIIYDERWLPIVGTGRAYRVSDLGEVVGVERRARTNNGLGESTRRVPRHRMSRTMRNGRSSVRICIDGQPRNILVSTAVLEAFVGPRPRGYMAEHINGDPTDCRLANLRWARRDMPTPANIHPAPANSSKLHSTMPPPQQTPANSNGWSP